MSENLARFYSIKIMIIIIDIYIYLGKDMKKI